MTGSGKRRAQTSFSAEGGQSVIVPASSALLAPRTGAQFAERDAALDVIVRDLLHRAVQIDRRVVAGLAQQRDHALRLAERIGADQMRALGKQRDGTQKFCDLAVGIAVAEHRQREGRLGDEDVAGHQLERRAGRIGDVLVIAGGDNAQSIGLDRDLRRAEHVAGGMERHLGAAEVDAFAIARCLRRPGEILAVAQPHQIERFLRRQHGAVAGAGVVGMGVRDQRPLDRPRRIDMKTAAACSTRRPASAPGCLQDACE